MTKAHDPGRPALEPRGEASANGPPSLRDRVQSLRLQPGGAVAQPRSTWLPWGLTAIALVVAGVFGWRAYRLSPADAGPAGNPSSSNTTTLSDGTSAGSLTATGDVVLDAKGYVIAAHQIQLSPQVGGEIIWLDPYFREGAVYRHGARLAEVDPEIYAAQVKSGEASVRIAEVNLRQVKTGSALQELAASRALLDNLKGRLEIAKIDERNKRAAGASIPRDDMEKANAQLTVDRAAYDQQREIVHKLEVSLEEQRDLIASQVQVAQANLEQSKKQLRNCTIVAPVDGIILTKKAEEHGYVNPLAFGAAGYLCEMADLTKLEIELDIQERDSPRVKEGQRCRIMPDSCQNDDAFKKTHPDGYLGVVSRRIPMANRSKGAITVRVQVDMPPDEKGGEYLLPDMGVLVSFLKK